eukprot:TRINITY_DN106697_c0_g1_i1.p1 TRINITY_DN106697_c0_g1~~TRINITY_DN106697_c0_g1_i1.p1  ORF type:complete len:402 (+),score=51.42 TRINITY_DN106697_c0_g1_i1:35-1207(+)
MAFCGSLCRLTFARLLPAVVALVAICVGWLNTHDMPMGVFFASLIPLMGGYAPPPIMGGWSTPGTEDVPADMQPLPRPHGEIFLEMPGGFSMPANGIGMCCRPTAYDSETVRRTVLWYLLLGGRHIDTADLYLNHAPIGQAIREAILRGIPRSEIFVTTKVFPNKFGMHETTKAVHRFLKELGLEYLDLVLMHAPAAFENQLGLGNIFGECAGKSNTACRRETWEALSQARESGLVRSVGVSNFNVKHLTEILSLSKEVSGIAPIAANQIQYNPWVPDWQQEVVHFCHQHGIVVTAWASVGGFMEKAAAETQKSLRDIAASKKASVAQVMLRWALQKNASVIPGTGKPKHMKENLNVYQMELTVEEMAKIDLLSADPEGKKFFFMKMDVA